MKACGVEEQLKDWLPLVTRRGRYGGEPGKCTVMYEVKNNPQKIYHGENVVPRSPYHNAGIAQLARVLRS